MPTKKAATAPKVMDIAHPGTVKADPTSVPLIVKHRPILKDPMMADESSAVEEPKKVEKSPSATKIELAPLGDAKTEKAEPSKPEDPKTEAKEENSKKDTAKNELAAKLPIEDDQREPDADVPAEKDQEEAPVETKEVAEAADAPDETSKTEDSIEQPSVAADPEPQDDLPTDDLGDSGLLPSAEPTDPAAAKAAREAAEKQLAYDKLVSDQTYFLPITTAEKRKARSVLLTIVLLLIVLSAVGFLAALDAGYLHINNFPAPTDFIYDK